MKTSRYVKVAFVALLPACADAAEDDALGPPVPYPIPGCEQFDTRPCDTRESDCQLRLLEIAACLRGDEPGDLPPIRVISKDEYRDQLKADYAASPPPDSQSFDHTRVLFGLESAASQGIEAQVEDAVSFVWGIYRGNSKEILLIDQGSPFDGFHVNALLVHELVHALQDRAVNLEAFRAAFDPGSSDSRLALRAVSEGEAEFIRYRYAVSALGLDPADVDLQRALFSAIEQSWEALAPPEGAADYSDSWSLFPYPWGARYFGHVFAAGGTGALSEVWTSPPTTTHALLASEDAIVEPDFEPVQLDTFVTAAGLRPSYELTLGAWGLFVLLARRGLSLEFASESAKAWRGDTYFVYEHDGAAAAVWRIAVADASTARELAPLLRGSEIQAEARATTITLGVSDPTLLLDWAFDP